MTDRDLLTQIQRDIATHMGTSTPSGFDLALRLPEKGYQGTPKGNFSGWVWPAPVYKGQEPMMTPNGYTTEHPAQDIAYLNIEGLPRKDPEVYGGKNPPGNKYYVPSDTIVCLAPGPGHIWFAGDKHYGWTIQIDHHDWVGFPLNTYQTHMSKLLIPKWKGEHGPYVYAGQPIGIVGAGPTHANHWHLELWDYSGEHPDTPKRNAYCLDPKLYLPHFGQVVLL